MTTPSTDHNIFHIPDPQSFSDAAAAIIQLDDGRYLMQHRDDKPGIFFPDHWGLFGGAIEPGENPEDGLRREIKEELDYDVERLEYFTTMNFGFECLGIAPTIRVFFLTRFAVSDLASLKLGEGQGLKALSAPEILLQKRVVPYDLFAIWLHIARMRQGPEV